MDVAQWDSFYGVLFLQLRLNPYFNGCSPMGKDRTVSVQVVDRS